MNFWFSSFWLLGITLYLLISRQKQFSVLLLSGAVVALLTILGPWSAFNVSAYSQVVRLKMLFQKNNLWVDGNVKPSPTELTSPDVTQMEEIVIYLEQRHRLSTIAPWFDQDIFAVKTTGADKQPTFTAMHALATYVHLSEPQNPYHISERSFNTDSIFNRNQLALISGYDVMITLSGGYLEVGSLVPMLPLPPEIVQRLPAGNQPITAHVNKVKNYLEVTQGKNILLHLDLLPKLRQLLNAASNSPLPLADMIIDAENNDVKARMFLTNITVNTAPDSADEPASINYFDGTLLLKIK